MAEVRDDLRRDVAQRHGVKEVFPSLDEAMQADWDAAVIATPAHLHIPMARRLADRGVNLLVEKPLSTSTDGIADLIEKVKAQGIVASVAYVYRAHPALTAMREALQSGRFGKPVQLISVVGQNFPTYRPAYRETYYTSHDTGGGAIQDAMAHMLNAAEWLVGPIDRVFADADHMVLEGVQVEDTVHIITRHGPLMGCYCLNQHQAPNEITFTVICEAGTLRFDLLTTSWRWMDKPGGKWHEEVFELPDRDSWFICQANAFLDTIEGESQPLCTLEQALQTLKVNLAALAAVKRGPDWQTIS